MRYLSTILAAVLVVAALLAIRALSDGRDRSPNSAKSIPASGALPTVALPEPTVASPEPTVALSEPTATQVPLVSRMAAIEYGRMRAGTFGERNPELIDAFVTTKAAAVSRLTPQDGRPPDGPAEGQSIVPDDAPVWLVRMRGSFTPPHGPPHAGPVPKERGWMFTVIDANSGQTVVSGFRPATIPPR